MSDYTVHRDYTLNVDRGGDYAANTDLIPDDIYYSI